MFETSTDVIPLGLHFMYATGFVGVINEHHGNENVCS